MICVTPDVWIYWFIIGVNRNQVQNNMSSYRMHSLLFATLLAWARRRVWWRMHKCSPVSLQRAVLCPSRGQSLEMWSQETRGLWFLWLENVSKVVGNAKMHFGLFCFFLEIRNLRHGVAWKSWYKSYTVILTNKFWGSMHFPPPFYMRTNMAWLRCGVDVLQTSS